MSFLTLRPDQWTRVVLVLGALTGAAPQGRTAESATASGGHHAVNPFKNISLLAALLCFDSTSAQNIVVPNLHGFAANPVALTDTEVSELSGMTPKMVDPTEPTPASRRLARKLSEHVTQFLESYEVPMRRRRIGPARAPDRFGVYALWLYLWQTGDSNALAAHWPAVRQRMRPLLDDGQMCAFALWTAAGQPWESL